MTPEQISHLPDTIAMAVLIAILLFLQRRQPRITIGSWLLAMTLILSSLISWHLLPNHDWYIPLHTYRLCTDLAAGVIFLLFTGQRLSTTPQRVLRLLWNAGPFLVLEILYGCNVARPAPYIACAVCGIVIGTLIAPPLHRKWTILPTLYAVWIVVVACAAMGNYRTAAYWALGSVYAAAAGNLWSRLRKGTIGHAVIVGSISFLSATFFLHTWMMAHPFFFPTAEETWSLQKFFITIGMLLTLLEDESLQNERLAMKDELTGLANRRMMERKLIEAVERGHAGLVLLDLDDFKQVNDSLGHSAGDELLRHVAVKLAQFTGEDDTLARLGGDEFLIITTQDVAALASGIRTSLENPVTIAGCIPVTIKASIGTSTFLEDAQDATGMDAVKQLLHAADSRMYATKPSYRDPDAKSGRQRDRRTEPVS